MTNLTQEQIQILETAFASLPEEIRTMNSFYVSMEGVQEQLNSGAKLIFYMKQNDMGGMDIHKMRLEE